jgi:hypothetical protein
MPMIRDSPTTWATIRRDGQPIAFSPAAGGAGNHAGVEETSAAVLAIFLNGALSKPPRV